MIIMKFGGTSIADASAIERVSNIIKERLSYSPIVVNSAMGKTTRNLLTIAQLSAAGKTEEAAKILNEIIQYHQTLGASVIPDFSENPVSEMLWTCFGEIKRLYEGVCVLQDLTDRSLDRFLSYGERMATVIMTAALQARDVPAVLMDARNCIITDDQFGNAKPLASVAFSRLKSTLLPVVQKQEVPVIQGYIGATEDGIVTTLGFEGSDLTATFIGAALNADEVQIWKDVPGIMTADPRVVDKAKTLTRITFDEAAELTFFGAKVLHPKAIGPVTGHDIPVHVCNSMDPKAPSTEVTQRHHEQPGHITSITSMKNLTLLRIQSKRNLPPYEYVRDVFDVLNRERLLVNVVSLTETRLAVVLEALPVLKHIIQDLERFAIVEKEDHKATVTLVGENLRQGHMTLHDILAPVKDIPLDLIAHRASAINITFVVDETRAETMVQRFHKYFIK